MVKKKSMKKGKTKAGNLTNEIEQLHACIQADQSKLDNAYKKSMAALEKSVSKLVSALDKIKKKAAKEKQGKQKAIDKKTSSSLSLLQADLEVLLKEKNVLSGRYKKFVAQQKLLMKFDRDWSKQSIKITKNKKLKRSTEKVKLSTEKPISLSEEVGMGHTVTESNLVD